MHTQTVTPKINIHVPTISAIEANQKRISQWIVETPVWPCPTPVLQKLGLHNEVLFKLELFQQTGSFKARGALTTLMGLDDLALRKGVVAASAGNHAIAVSYAAKVFNTRAKVVMPKTASPIKIQRCKDYGAEVVLMDSITQVFDKMQEIAKVEERTAVHPFEGPLIALGTATLGLELVRQIPNLEAVIIPVGGGGLCAGVATAVKQLLPHCLVYGVEPEGADAMYQSFATGAPVKLDAINTIAESLAAPCTMPYSFALCHRFVNDIVRVSDVAMAQAMALMFYELKLAVEPAAAAAMAALCGPLQQTLAGKRVAVIVSGTNIDLDRYYAIVKNAV